MIDHVNKYSTKYVQLYCILINSSSNKSHFECLWSLLKFLTENNDALITALAVFVKGNFLSNR